MEWLLCNCGLPAGLEPGAVRAAVEHAAYVTFALASPIMSAVDTAFVGQYASVAELAAMGPGTMVRAAEQPVAPGHHGRREK